MRKTNGGTIVPNMGGYMNNNISELRYDIVQELIEELAVMRYDHEIFNNKEAFIAFLKFHRDRYGRGY